MLWDTYTIKNLGIMASEKGHSVELYIYDLTNGLAAVLSPAILGRAVEGVWHTAVVVYGREYFFGAAGIVTCAPGTTQLGEPLQVERLGETFVPYEVFCDYIQGLATTTYKSTEYQLLQHNCNHFCDEVAQFLCGARCPKHILHQPESLPPPLRLALTALLDNLLPTAQVIAGGVRQARQDSPEYTTLNDQIEQARAQGAALERRRATLADKLARKERRRNKRARAGHDMAEAVAARPASPAAEARAGPSSAALALEADERQQEELRRRARDPPIVYRDIDGAAEFEKFLAALEPASLTAEERNSVDELQQYLVQGEGSWVLGDDFLDFVGRILRSEEAALAGARCGLLRCLAAMALRDDVSLVLHQDRRQHALLGYAHRVDTLPPPEQAALALFMCNLFENVSSSEWLLYISEWEAPGCSQPLSNIRATTKVCVHAALADTEELREVGTALMHNVATKERLSAGGALRPLLPPRAKSKVFDEVCAELALALLQLVGNAPREEHMWRALKALARLVHHSPDVPALIAMVGPDPTAFRGTSARVDEQIDIIAKKLK